MTPYELIQNELDQTEEKPVLIDSTLYLEDDARLYGYTNGKVFELKKLEDGSTHRAYTYGARAYSGIFLRYIENHVGKDSPCYEDLTKHHEVAHTNRHALNTCLAHKIQKKYPCKHTRRGLIEAHAHSKEWTVYAYELDDKQKIVGASFYDGKNVVQFRTLKDILNGRKRTVPANEIDSEKLDTAKKAYVYRGYATLELQILSLRDYSTMQILKTLHRDVRSCMLQPGSYEEFASMWRAFYYRNGFKVALFSHDGRPVGRMLVYDRGGIKARTKDYGACSVKMLKDLGYGSEYSLEGEEVRFKRLGKGNRVAAPYIDAVDGNFSFVAREGRYLLAAWGKDCGDYNFTARSQNGRIEVAEITCCNCNCVLDTDNIRQDNSGDVFCAECYADLYMSCAICGYEACVNDTVETALLYADGRYETVECCNDCAEGRTRGYALIYALRA